MLYILFIDEWILKRCTKISHGVQEWTGLTNYFFVKVGLFMNSLSIVARIVNYWWPIMESKTSMFGLLVYFILLLLAIRDVHICTKNEERLYNNQTLYLFKQSSLNARLIWVIFSIWDTVYAINVFPKFLDIIGLCFFSWGLLVVYYFLAVTPLPPGMSKVTKLVESISAGFRKMTPVSTKG